MYIIHPILEKYGSDNMSSILIEIINF